MFQSCPLPMTLMESRTATLEMEMGRKGVLSMLCWTGRRNECEPSRLSKNHKHTLSIQIIIRSIYIAIHFSEFNSYTLSAELGIRYIN